jgi:hypothetical protein
VSLCVRLEVESDGEFNLFVLCSKLAGLDVYVQLIRKFKLKFICLYH